MVRSTLYQRPLVFLAALVSANRSRPLFRSERESELFEKFETAEALGLLREVRRDLERTGETRPARMLQEIEAKFFTGEESDEADI